MKLVECILNPHPFQLNLFKYPFLSTPYSSMNSLEIQSTPEIYLLKRIKDPLFY